MCILVSCIDSVVDGACSGIGCCQASILPGVKDFSVDIRSFRNLSKVRSFNPCGYAFVVQADAFEFSSLDLLNMNRTTVPVVLDWSIGNVTCQVAQRNHSTYVCQTLHSECLDASHGRGYRCNCVKGFQGNPYLPDGCQDIDECKTSNPCIGTCQNLVGNYSCSCPEGFEGDGEKNGYGCHRRSHHPKKEIEGSTLFYIASGLVIPGVGSFWIFRRRKLKKLAKLRRSTFESNGGLILEYMLSTQPTAMFRVFTAEEIKRATDNYAESRILSCSCVFRTVYRGKLDDAGESKLVTVTIYHMREEEMKVFIRKLVSFSQLNHKNVSKLIGCCLETQVPLFVNEFVSINTLSDYILDDDLASSLSWDTRLRIAAETAGALAYLHSEAGLPIIHGNLSSLTISLHNGSTVKIHDVAFINYCDSSAVLYWMGASGHLDPEYLYSGLWTVKSDVYSFGVVLAELLTGNRSIKFFRVNEYFVSSFEGDALLTILDNRLAIKGKIEQLRQVSKLAKKCLSDSSVERPTMKEVEVALASIISGRSPNSRAVSQKSTQVPIASRLLRRNKSL